MIKGAMAPSLSTLCPCNNTKRPVVLELFGREPHNFQLDSFSEPRHDDTASATSRMKAEVATREFTVALIVLSSSLTLGVAWTPWLGRRFRSKIAQGIQVELNKCVNIVKLDGLILGKRLSLCRKVTACHHESHVDARVDHRSVEIPHDGFSNCVVPLLALYGNHLVELAKNDIDAMVT